MQYTTRLLFVAMLVVAWISCVFKPGGVYVVLPIGLGIGSLFLFADLIRKLIQTKKTGSKLFTAFSRVVVCFLGIGLFLALYLPFLSLASNQAAYESQSHAKRHFVINSMDAEEIREHGLQLLQAMALNSIENLFPDSPLVSAKIRNLSPLYIESRGDHLMLVFGTGEDSYDLFIYQEPSKARGSIRLGPGIWFFQPRSKRWLTDLEWNAGQRE